MSPACASWISIRCMPRKWKSIVTLDWVLLSVAMNTNDLIAHLHFAADDFAESDTTEVIVVIEVRDEHLELAGVRAGRRNVFDDRVEERFHVVGRLLDVELGVTGLGAGVNDGEIELFVGGVQGHEQFEDLVENLVRIGVVAIDLVDDDDWLGAGFKRFSEHETGLRLGTFGSIDHEQHAIDHVHDTFDFAAEVGVAGSVDDVDVVILVLESGVLGLDGDPLFPFEIHRVHHPLFRRLVGAKSP